MDLQKTIEELFRTDYRPLCLYSLHLVRSAEAAEDIVTGCFQALWERMGSVSSPRSYLWTSVRNASLAYLKHVPTELEEDLSSEQIDDDTQEGLRERSYLEARLWDAIERMPERRRQVLLMAKRDGMSYLEIAEELGVSENTVRNTLAKAMESLRSSRKDILDFVIFFY